jgi:hypothetical protein
MTELRHLGIPPPEYRLFRVAKVFPRCGMKGFYSIVAVFNQYDSNIVFTGGGIASFGWRYSAIFRVAVYRSGGIHT